MMFDCYRGAPDDRDWWDVVVLAEMMEISVAELIDFLMIEHYVEVLGGDQRVAGPMMEAA